MAWSLDVAPHVMSWHASDPAEVRSRYLTDYGAQSSVGHSPSGAPPEIAVDQLRLGPLEVSEHARNVDVAYRFERHDVYAVFFAASGSFSNGEHGREPVASSTRAVVYRPDSGRMIARAAAGSTSVLLLVKRWALHNELSRLLDRPVPATIPFPPVLDFAAPAGWLQVLGVFRTALRDRDSIVLEPVVAEPLCHALLAGLLMCSLSPFVEELRRPVARRRPRAVRAVTDLIDAHPEGPHTIESLAAHANISARTLQALFGRYVGMPPTVYLRQVRLARVHDDLSTGRAGSVADAAHRWGFTHLGRFAAAYRVQYGSQPSQTLRRS